MGIARFLLIPLSLVSSVSAATYDFTWDARQLEYTCQGLKEQTGKDWIPNGDFCVHFSDNAYWWEDASIVCSQQSFSSSSPLSELSWLQLRLLSDPTHNQRYWTALRFKDAESLLDGPVSTSIYNPSWSDNEPTSLDDACIAIDLSLTSTKSRGWHFEQCDVPLPVICQTFACIGDEFRCADNTRCIPKAAVNDGFEDCLDGSDEYSSNTVFSSSSLNISRAFRMDAPDTTTITNPISSTTTTKKPDQRSSTYDCPLPQDLRNVDIVGSSGYNEFDIITWQCNSGYAPRALEPSLCVNGKGWDPPIECNVLNCNLPYTENITFISGTLHGDRAMYTTQATAIDGQLTRVAVCDEGTWVYMNDELDDICLSLPIKFGHFDKDKYSLEENMTFSCENGFISSSAAEECQGGYFQPACEPTPLSATDCNGTVKDGPPLFARDWCACADGGVEQGGECKGYNTDACTSPQDTCSAGKVCTRNETAGEDFHCECPIGSCLYPFGDCENEAFLPGVVDKNTGECATLRCPIDDLKVPSNCIITTYPNAKAEIDMRLGTTDVICSHNTAGGKIQTRHAVQCGVDGQWKKVEFNQQCNATKGLIFDKEQYDPFETTNVAYSSYPAINLSIRCNGNGQWMGLVPTDKCVNGILKVDSNLVRCVCNDDYFGEDCSSPCDQGTPKGDGTCDCFDGFHGDHCEVEEKCMDSSPYVEADGEKIALVFIVDLYKDGFVQFITNEQSGLISSVQQLIRDISYYDGKFVGNMTLITFGTSPSITTKTFLWSEVDKFVNELVSLETQMDTSCKFGLDDVLEQLSYKMNLLPRGTIISMFSVQPSRVMNELTIDAFVNNGIIANVITDSSVVITGCATKAGTFNPYLRLAKLTGGYYLDGFTAASFMQILPRFYKSSVVLIPALMLKDTATSFPFMVDSAAQSMIVYSYDPLARSSIFALTGNTSPDNLNLASAKNHFQVFYNSISGNWQAQKQMDGYYFVDGGTTDYNGAVDECEKMGGTVADFINNNVCSAARYWVPIRYSRSLSNPGWYANYRGTSIPVTTNKFDVPSVPSSGLDCAAFDCTDFKWHATSCEDQIAVLCQKAVFDPSKKSSLPNDQIRSDAGFALMSQQVNDYSTWISVRVQSTNAFDYKLTDLYDNQVASITSGSSRIRMSAGDSFTASSSFASVFEDNAIYRSQFKERACASFPITSTPLFCLLPSDVVIQVSNKQGATVRSFIARCVKSDFPEVSPPSDCAATGCIAENTGFCHLDENRQYKCSCKRDFSGQFCEYRDWKESTCNSLLQTELNDASIDSTIKTGGCGCTLDMYTCSFNRDDPCGNRCSPDSSCQFIDTVYSTANPSVPIHKAVAACFCNPNFEGEFCDRKKGVTPTDCSGNPCHNGGKCVQLVDPTSIKCFCADGYTGEYCDIPLGLCTPYTCENGGICSNLDPLTTFCMCQIGFAGDRCERKLDIGCFNGGKQLWDGSCQCTLPWTGTYCTLLKFPMPLEVCGCSNGATCVYDVKEGKEQTSCKCPYNFVGDKCQTRQSVCGHSPCGEHGTCIAQPNDSGYKCKCDDNYAGELCDIFTGDPDCDENTCLNGGTCKEGKCTCRPPNSGTHCQNTVSCDGYCLNEGQCTEINDKPVCQCKLRFTGKQCEKENKDKSYNLKITPASQQMYFGMNELQSVFSVCAWIRAMPKDVSSNPEMPIFEIQFGDKDKLRVTTWKATVKGQSLGAFNMRLQQWQQFCVRCSSTNCTAFSNGIWNGINLSGHFSTSSTYLLIAPPPTNEEDMMLGEISRLSIYNKAISDDEAASFAFDCASTVGDDAIADDVWWKILDQSPRQSLVSPGLCETSPCWPGTCASHLDKSPPVATFCPPDRFQTSSRPVVIKWDEPVFEDDQSVSKIDSNYRSGDIFVWGEYHVVYTATDPSNNTGRCEFDIFLAPNRCDTPNAPSNGDVTFKETFDGESGSFLEASIQCIFEEYPYDGPKFYVCDYMGQWQRSYYSPASTRTDIVPAFTFPACGEVTEQDQTMDGKVHFDASNNCDQLRAQIKEAINNVLEGVCSDGTPDCADVNISECPDGLNRRSAKADQESPELTYEIIIKSDDPLIYQNVESELEKIDGVNDVQVDEPVIECGKDHPLHFLSNGKTLCAEVPPGFFYNKPENMKVQCPKNQYQDDSNSDHCNSCPPGTITQSEGATKASDCYEECPAGQWCDFNTPVDATSGAFEQCCEKCAKGSYASEKGSLQCISCKDGATTGGEGSTRASDCFWPCQKGEEANENTGTTGTCTKCQKGKYKDSTDPGQCRSCATGLTTPGEGSTSSTDCSLLYCPPNTYVNPDAKGSINPSTFNLNDFCIPCAKGTWQPKYNFTSCDKCPNTPASNNQDPPTCRLENECSPQQTNGCGDGKKCVQNTDNNYYHCVEDNSAQQNDNGSLVWWQIILIVAGSCLAIAAIIAVAVIVAMRCCNVGKKVKDTDTLAHERRTTGDNFGSTVPDKEEEHFDDLPTPMLEMPPVQVDMYYLYNKPLTVPPTPVVEQLPIEYQRQAPIIPSAAVVRMRKRMSNASRENYPRQSRPFSNDSIASVPSIRDPIGRSSGNFFVPSVTIRSNSESSLDSFSVGSASSRQSGVRQRVRPDSSQIVHALIDALDEDRFRGGWDKESSIL